MEVSCRLTSSRFRRWAAGPMSRSGGRRASHARRGGLCERRPEPKASTDAKRPERSEGVPCDPEAQGDGSTVRSADSGGKDFGLSRYPAGA